MSNLCLTTENGSGIVYSGANNFIITQAPIAMVSGLFLRLIYGGSAKNKIPVRGIIPPFLCKVISSRRQGSLISLFVGANKHLTQEVIMFKFNSKHRTCAIINFPIQAAKKQKKAHKRPSGVVVEFPIFRNETECEIFNEVTSPAMGNTIEAIRLAKILARNELGYN